MQCAPSETVLWVLSITPEGHFLHLTEAETSLLRESEVTRSVTEDLEQFCYS